MLPYKIISKHRTQDFLMKSSCRFSSWHFRAPDWDVASIQREQRNIGDCSWSSPQCAFGTKADYAYTMNALSCGICAPAKWCKGQERRMEQGEEGRPRGAAAKRERWAQQRQEGSWHYTAAGRQLKGQLRDNPFGAVSNVCDRL